MDKKELKKTWNNFLVDSDKTLKEIALQENITPSALGQRINNGSIKFIDFVNIIEKHGYTIKIVKKDDRM